MTTPPSSSRTSTSSKTPKDLVKWSEFGILKSPFQTLGLDEDLYKTIKKSELYTDTKKYLGKRNKYVRSIADKVNDAWLKTMKEMADVPFGERKKLADKIALKVSADQLKIADELYPNANQALEQAANLGKVADIVEGNLAVKPARKPRAPKAPKVPMETSAPTGKKRKTKKEER